MALSPDSRRSEDRERSAKRDYPRSPNVDRAHSPAHGNAQDSTEAGSGYSARTEDEEPVNLYVRGIPREFCEISKLEDAIKPFAKVISCSVVFEPYSKECRGFGFVKVATEADAEAAMNPDNPIYLMGSALRLEKARRSGPHSKSPGQYLGVDRSAVRQRSFEGPGQGYRGGGYPPRGGFSGNARGGYAAGYDRRFGGGYEGKRPNFLEPNGYGGYAEPKLNGGREVGRGGPNHGFDRQNKGAPEGRGGHGGGGFGYPREGVHGRFTRDGRDLHGGRNGRDSKGDFQGNGSREYHADTRYADDRNRDYFNKRRRIESHGDAPPYERMRPKDV